MRNNRKKSKREDNKRNPTKILQNNGGAHNFVWLWMLGSESKGLPKIETSEMRFLKEVKGGIKADRIRNENIRQELGITPLLQKIQQYKIKYREHVNRMQSARIPGQIINKKIRRRSIGMTITRWWHRNRQWCNNMPNFGIAKEGKY